MKKNQSLKLAATVFGMVAVFHLIRSLFSWSATINHFEIPLYFSYVAFIVMGILGFHMYGESKKK
jgi:cytochrome c biogenesis protein CcdA